MRNQDSLDLLCVRLPAPEAQLIRDYVASVRAEAAWSALEISMLAAMMTGRLDDDIKTLTGYLGEEDEHGR